MRTSFQVSKQIKYLQGKKACIQETVYSLLQKQTETETKIKELFTELETTLLKEKGQS
jgi:hypothetical protein